MVDTSTNNSNADMFETPGQVLRLQREKQGLSAQEIAARIHLDVKIIDAIENDSADGMPAAIYVRGYLRSYAKIVNVNADEIIKLYNADSPPPPPEILPEVKPPTQVSSNDKPVKAFTYLVTLGLVLLLLVWYQSNFVVDTQINNGQLNTPTSINGVDITYQIIHHPDSWQSPVDDSKEDVVEESAAPESSEQNNTLELKIYDETQTNETTAAEVTGNNSSLSIIGLGPDTIDIAFTNDSWVEIHDAKNKRLLHQLARAGRQYRINGIAPITVVLGFSKGVALKFNGIPFDIESHSNSGVARFTLPE